MGTQHFFHGGYTPVNTPDLDHSRSDIEFGKGFYLTADNILASKWACKYRGKINGSFVSTYTLDANDLNIYSFSLDQEWLDFVVANRNGKAGDPKFKEYDMLIGAMVDDNLFNVIDMYDRGFYAAEKTIKLVNCLDYGLQYVIKSQKALDKLIFETSKELQGLEKQSWIQAFKQDNVKGSQTAEKVIREVNRGDQL